MSKEYIYLKEYLKCNGVESVDNFVPLENNVLKNYILTMLNLFFKCFEKDRYLFCGSLQMQNIIYYDKAFGNLYLILKNYLQFNPMYIYPPITLVSSWVTQTVNELSVNSFNNLYQLGFETSELNVA